METPPPAPPNDTRQLLAQFNVAVACMSVIPLLLCAYLLAARFFTLEIFLGLNGLYFLVGVVTAVAGMLYGHAVVRRVIRQLVQAKARADALLQQMAQTTVRIEQELLQRKQAEEVIVREKAELARLNKLMMGREERILELKQEINTLLAGEGQPPRYSV